MSSDFNPYYVFLGIPPSDQPLDHYRLLSLERLESNLDIIAMAADRQMGHLRRYEAGEHGVQVTKLMNEVSRARLCLLNAKKKAEYDRQLQQTMVAVTSSETTSVAQESRPKSGKTPPRLPQQPAAGIAVTPNERKIVEASVVLKKERKSQPSLVATQTSQSPDNIPVSSTVEGEKDDSRPRRRINLLAPLILADRLLAKLAGAENVILHWAFRLTATAGVLAACVGGIWWTTKKHVAEVTEVETAVPIESGDSDVPQSPDSAPVVAADESTSTATASNDVQAPVARRITLVDTFGAKTVSVGDELTFVARAMDQAGPASDVHFSLKNAPAGATIDLVTGVFRWTPDKAQAGSNYQITVQVAEINSTTVADERSLPIAVTSVATPTEVVVARPIGRYSSEGQVLARFDPRAGEWLRLTADSPLLTGDRLLALPNYRPRIEFLSGAQLEISGPSQLLFGHATDVPDVPLPTISLSYGQVSLTAVGVAGTRMGLALGNRQGVVTFDNTDSTLAIEVRRNHAPGSDPETEAPQIVARLIPMTGTITWYEGGRVNAVDAGNVWTMIDDRAGTLESIEEFPPWDASGGSTGIDILAFDEFEGQLDPSRPLLVSLNELAADRRMEIRMAAAVSMSYLEVYEPTIASLNDPLARSQWSAAVDALREALARDPASAGRVRTALENLRGDDAQQIYRMLCGYRPEQLAAGEAAQLVDGLEHESLDIRVVAIENLRQITGRTLAYQPDVPVASRASAVRSWRTTLAADEIKYATTTDPGLSAVPTAIDNDPAQKVAPTENITLDTKDGVELRCSYYPGTPSKETVPVILLHGWDGSRDEFRDFATALQRRGHTVIVPDLRGHGESTRLKSGRLIDRDQMDPADVTNLVQFDVDAVKKLLIEKNNAGLLNIDLLCLIGAETGALVASNWAAYDWNLPQAVRRRQGQDTKVLIMLSPVQTFRGLDWTGVAQHPVIRDKLPIMIAAGAQNQNAIQVAMNLHSVFSLRRISGLVEFASQPCAEQGTKLLDPNVSPGLTQQVLQFIDQQLVAHRATFPWANRR